MNTPNDAAAIAAKQRQLDVMTAKLSELRAGYGVLMNAFKFDEARALHARIEATEREHRELIAQLPSHQPEATPRPYRVAMRRHRRR
jgi:hypothetical protein